MNKRKKFLGQYVVVSSFLIVLLLSLVGGFATQIVKTIQYNKEIAQLKSNIKNVDKEIKDLKKDKQRLDNDKYIEDIARERLKMVKSNEIIYIDINKGSK
ncbi:septum formation initiation protein [[Clostridium] sordellii]|uniref:FtsB family cell division protein n=1 Tax=Paraclostridium sordellii TaxID=1505 RepID=UPI0005DA70BA|nr:septum formation initiator family protein [Paeniclostridium sordellii]MCQ4698908.1 septum formation initiator family protein [Paeniclostridium sordellii]CEQ32160.1 septum formation initiation protein [[Clostridium] sordellii] [Paeniclostridium sordellii]